MLKKLAKFTHWLIFLRRPRNTAILVVLLIALNIYQYKEREEWIDSIDTLEIELNLLSEKILGKMDDASPMSHFEKRLIYEEESPDKKHTVILYEVSYPKGTFENEYDAFSNQAIIAVKGHENGRESYIFVGDYRTGYPHWLGNEHVVFTAGCGTGCVGFNLLNVLSKEMRHGLFITTSGGVPVQTFFSDWFGKEHVFSDGFQDVRTETEGKKSYLIFEIHDDEYKPLGERRFLFTGDSLQLLY